ncbi:hypothetical protein HAX54_045932, partial [Datura stramonium]|nr:hypothetical protein [Datura stramonium]
PEGAPHRHFGLWAVNMKQSGASKKSNPNSTKAVDVEFLLEIYQVLVKPFSLEISFNKYLL